MKNEAKKAAIAAYKERKTIAGLYAVKCGSSGEVWVGAAPNIDTIQNRIWFSLKQGGSFNRPMQAAWNAHGPDGFSFDVLERIDEKLEGYERDAALKERLAHWRDALKAGVAETR